MRLKAALSHFILSVTIFCMAIFILRFYWYPSPYFTASGGWQGLKIVAGVDLVLGPLLTLIIFDIAKPRKKLVGDLIVIALLQFIALAWGIYTIYSQRPVAVVFWDQDFILVPAVEYEKQGIELNDLRQFGIESPVLIYAEKPRELAKLKEMLKRIKEHTIAPHYQLELYRPLHDNFVELVRYQLNMDSIIEHNADVKRRLEIILKETNKKYEDFYYFPLRSKYHNIILLFSHEGELENHIVMKL